MNRCRTWWNNASFFWKTYLLAVLFVGSIILLGEVFEEYWSGILGQDMPYWQREVCLWVLATVLPTAFGCLWLTRLFTGPVRRLTANLGKLSAGDLSSRMDAHDATRQDDLGTLARAFNLMADRLEQVRLAERRLLVDISHELRSPLTRMGVALALLRRDEGGSTSDGRLERLELEMERMNTLIGQLLTHARQEAGERPRVRIDLCALIESVVADALFESNSRGTADFLPVRSELVPAAVWGDAELLHRAIDNVVRNALRYSPEDQPVEIRLVAAQRDGQQEWLVTVTDAGPGVPEAALPDLFRVFYRVDEARSRDSGGVGLGLAIAEQAVRLHGGQISAANRAPYEKLSQAPGVPGTSVATGLVVSLFLPSAGDSE